MEDIEVKEFIPLDHLMSEESVAKLKAHADDPFVQEAINRMQEDDVDAADVLVDLVCDLMHDVKRANRELSQLHRGGEAS